jgi:hypothetical protein
MATSLLIRWPSMSAQQQQQHRQQRRRWQLEQRGEQWLFRWCGRA